MCGCGTTEWCEGGCECGCDHGTPEGMGRQGRNLARTLAAWKEACALHGDAYNEGVEQGQRDMLAKAIAVIDTPEPWVGGRKAAVAALRALLTEGSE